MRLQRLHSKKGSGNAAVYKEATGELQLPLFKKFGPVVDQLVTIMDDVLPDLPGWEGSPDLVTAASADNLPDS